MKTVIVIPAFNEEKTIGEVVSKAKKYGSVIVVDDGSSDRTLEIAEKREAVVLHHKVNLGKGAALKTGCDAAILKKAENIIIMDSDGQHDADEIPLFLEELKENKIVFSKRVKREDMPLFAKIGNEGLKFVSNLLFNVKINDPQSGFRAFTNNCYSKIRWNVSGYSVENEIIARVSAKKIKYSEIPIKTIYHNDYKGTGIFDGLGIFFDMLIWRLTIWS